jgi:plastocyanin
MSEPMQRTRGWMPLGLLLGSLLFLGACSSAASSTPIQIEIHYSHFNPSQLTVPHGQPITFLLVNDDPIDHEWIVGTAEVHRLHRTGTEPYHASRPTEVTIPALSTRTTTVTFDTPGILTYVCHLPGHEAYGMIGPLEVT